MSTSLRHTVKVAVFVLLKNEGNIFMLRRAHTGWADGMWTIPSGHVEHGETPIEAAIKETHEEAGVTVHAADLQFVHVHAVGDVYVNFYFVTEKWKGEPFLAEPDKCNEVAWVSLNSLPSDTIMQVRSLIKNMRGGSYFSEIKNDPTASE